MRLPKRLRSGSPAYPETAGSAVADPCGGRRRVRAAFGSVSAAHTSPAAGRHPSAGAGGRQRLCLSGGRSPRAAMRSGKRRPTPYR